MVQKNIFKLDKLKKLNFKNIKKIPWIIGQPLTKIPDFSRSRISDLFVWINSKEINTFYEFMDLPSLFENKNSIEKSFFNLMIFDKYGELIKNLEIPVLYGERIVINLNDHLKNISDEIGTFSIFHQKTPEEIQNLGSFISDRGYVKYYSKKLDIFKYVHGNLDAISYDDNDIKNLGVNSFLSRKYFIQCKIEKENKYRFYLVNFTNKIQNYSLYSYKNNKIINRITIKPRGCGFSEYKCNSDNEILYIKSKLVMSRPLIYSEKNNDLDFFHG